MKARSHRLWDACLAIASLWHCSIPWTDPQGQEEVRDGLDEGGDRAGEMRREFCGADAAVASEARGADISRS
ncbi:hypothetical protein RV134_320108 [Roseovarius sp. EC-HK134]|nr:hypothetical protein RV134_320108 [Roseovarius sp. EC-HK134]